MPDFALAFFVLLLKQVVAHKLLERAILVPQGTVDSLWFAQLVVP